jgi:hypothetical protein
MAKTPKEMRKVQKTGAARVRATVKGKKDPSKVPGMSTYKKVSNSTSKKAMKYDAALMKGQDKAISKVNRRSNG